MSERVMKSTDLETSLKNAIADTIKLGETYPGYPKIRLTINHPEVARQLSEGGISLLPDGPWDAGSKNLLPSPDQELQLLKLQGYQFDDAGRPLHPWLIDMISNPNVGVVTGTGAYWKLGPNKTTDPIVLTTERLPHLLLVLRSDNNNWALPGGFIDPGEDGATAGRREAKEETGLILTGNPEAVIYEGVVADGRTTAYAWSDTFAAIWRVSNRTRLTPQYSEVKDARWFPYNDLPPKLHGSHRALLKEAVKYL